MRVEAPALGDQPLLVRLLRESGVLDEARLEQLAAARLKHPESLEEALAKAGLVADEALARAYAEYLGVSWLDWARQDSGDEQRVVERMPDGSAVAAGTLAELVERIRPAAEALGGGLCRRRRVLPVSQSDGALELACVDPCDILALEEIGLRSGRVVQPHAIVLSLYEAAAGLLFGERDEVREIASEDAAPEGGAAEARDEDLEVVVDLHQAIPPGRESQVIRIVNVLLSGALEAGASDIHLEPYEDEVRVRYRIDGELHATTPPPRSLFVPTISRLKILAKMDIAEKRVPQDGAISLKAGERRVDLRVSTVPTVYGEKMVIRILEKNAIPPALQSLGFSERQAGHFMNAAESPHGLIFVTGPTGSGKSTTLYCVLNLINQPNINIVTVEDPVEYRFHGLNQVHVRSKVGLTFASALRSFLRQDPDVIMVGEVRDQETAEICMRAALTGHLVLSTLHTNDSLQVINRLVEMGIEPFLLGPALRLVEAQRLVRRLCVECKTPYELPAEVAERYRLQAGARLYRPGQGSCPACRGSGYKGRVGLYELVLIIEPLQQLVAERAPLGRLRARAVEEGFQFLGDSAREKLLAGATSLDEVAEYLKEEQ